MLKSRISRVRRWEYIMCVLESARQNETLKEIEMRLVKTKIDFERKKSLAIGRGKTRKKGLNTAKVLVQDSKLMAATLGLIKENEKLQLTNIGKAMLNLDIQSKEYLDIILPRLFSRYLPIVELFRSLLMADSNEIMLPQRRNIREFRKVAEKQNLFIGQMDFVIARNLLGQLGIINWFLVDKGDNRHSRVYLSSIVKEERNLVPEDADFTLIEYLNKKITIQRKKVCLSEFSKTLWKEYLKMARGIPLKPVFYSSLRDNVCYKTRISDIEFDHHMSTLLENHCSENYHLFGSGGTIPFSHYSSSVLKSLPLKFSNGRYIIYIKMEEIDKE